ncbi:MAG TPA: type II toxin-antitoxin system RelE/ParE family toxin [Novosphingobium sp.]|nr:type II toxin-antitoxin system RelE/ParE family toxin [Novosphingobium sp.]
MKVYELRFGRHALRQWNRLDPAIRKQFARKLEKIVHNPNVPSMRMSGYRDSYRLKLRKAGYRLAYRVFDSHLVVIVISVGHRDKDEVYDDFDLHYHEGEP